MNDEKTPGNVVRRGRGWAKLVSSGAAMMVAALMGITALSTPAYADIPSGDLARVSADCPASWFCIWTDPNYRGRYLRTLRGHDNPNVGAAWNDRASSLWNRTGRVVSVFRDSNFNGAWRGISAGNSHHDLRNDYYTHVFPFTLNDSITSWVNCCNNP